MHPVPQHSRPPPSRSPALATLAAVLAFSAAPAALSACGAAGSGAKPVACSERAQCAADAFCRDGACVQGAAPVARIASPDAETAKANRVLSFDATGSRDPDAEDRVVSFQWRTVTVDAPCNASPVEVDGGRYRVLIPCPGSFRVELTVTDSTGMVSAPTQFAVRVAPDEYDPPVLAVGAALTLDHRCDGDPLTCTPIDGGGATAFALAATASGGRPPLALRWTATPPPALPSRHTISFSDPASSAPSVTLRTDGAIAGEWTFTAVVTDADGRSAVREQRVAIRNRPPVASAPVDPIAVAHRYDAIAMAFQAEAPLPDPRFVDPDGDPVAVSFTSQATGDGGHGMSFGDGLVHVSVPGAEPQHLIGDGVERQVVVLGDDGNGAVVRLEAPLQILNRAPRIASARSGATVPHQYDPARRVYTAGATLSDYVDDDGDPLVAGAATELGTRGCSSLSLAGNTLKVSCEVPLTTVAALSVITGTHVLDVGVRDPWIASPSAAARVDVTNAAPQVMVSSAAVKATYSEDSDPAHCCVKLVYDYCSRPPAFWAAGSSNLLPVIDPDGDPLDVTYQRSSTVLQLSRTSATACRGWECQVTLQLPATGSSLSCQVIPDPGTLTIAATDGVAGASGTVTVYRDIL